VEPGTARGAGELGAHSIDVRIFIVLSLKCPVYLVSSLTIVFLIWTGLHTTHIISTISEHYVCDTAHGSHLSLADCSSRVNSVRWKILFSFTNLCEGLRNNCITDWLMKQYHDGALARLHDWKYLPFCVCWTCSFVSEITATSLSVFNASSICNLLNTYLASKTRYANCLWAGEL
jgi:hypothetical protein